MRVTTRHKVAGISGNSQDCNRQMEASGSPATVTGYPTPGRIPFGDARGAGAPRRNQARRHSAAWRRLAHLHSQTRPICR